MIIIKYGGSILNPDGKYDKKAIEKLKKIINTNPNEEFCFIIGGGKLCRYLQEQSQEQLKQALPKEQINRAKDEIGIAVTKINAYYLLKELQKTFGEEIFPELLLNPYEKPTLGKRIYLATGYKPGYTTDYDMMRLSSTLKAQRAIKISDFKQILDVKPLEIEKENLEQYTPISKMTWEEILTLVGTEYVAGGNYPLDPKAVELGTKLGEKGFTLLVGRYEELDNMIEGKEFIGTTIKN